MTTLSFDQIRELIRSRSQAERIQLIEDIAETLKQEIVEDQPRKARRSLAGLWEGVSVSAEDIDEARREMMKNFPREDI